jgi:ubiquinone biosynthesis protein COQ9
MARRPTARAPRDLRDRVVEAALTLAAERDWDSVRLADIAERAGVGRAELRDEFSGKLAILAAFSARIDRQVLAALDPELSAEPARDRLFDVMMARFDALQPHRAAVRSIGRAVARRPAAMIAWSPIALRSMSWMLEGAGIDASGRLGGVRTQGLAWAFGRTLRVWLEDDDPGMARTMVELDRRLREGEGWLRRLDLLCGLAEAPDQVLDGERKREDLAAPVAVGRQRHQEEAEGGARTEADHRDQTAADDDDGDGAPADLCLRSFQRDAPKTDSNATRAALLSITPD